MLPLLPVHSYPVLLCQPHTALSRLSRDLDLSADTVSAFMTGPVRALGVLGAVRRGIGPLHALRALIALPPVQRAHHFHQVAAVPLPRPEAGDDHLSLAEEDEDDPIARWPEFML